MAEVTKTDTIRRNKSRGQRQTKLIIVAVCLIFLSGSLYTIAEAALTYFAGLGMIAEISWENTAEGPAWSFQRELVTTTDEGGVLIPMVNEGERVSKGLEIARLNFLGDTRLSEPGNRRIYSPVAGIVSFEPDGLELVNGTKDYAELTIPFLESKIGDEEEPRRGSQGLTGLIQDKLEQENWDAGEETDSAAGQEPAAPAKTEPKEVYGGTAIVKVTDNLSDCYIYMRLPAQEEEPFQVADTVTMRLDEGNPGKGTVLLCEEISAGWGLLMKLESGLEPLRHGRRHRLTLVLGTDARIAAPAGSVVMKDGETGVYMVEKHKVRWTPVSITEEKDGLQFIEGTEPGDISPGDVIATRPWLIWDGMRLRD
ncbi:MAG: hypothetical protein FWG28_02625 [Clostridiales bacterium]|nr:hypothetical protein [Clostridiales bacterium]